MLESGGQVLIRSGKPSDAEVLAGIFRESWELAYRGIIPHLHLASLIKRRGPSAWKKALRNADGTLVMDVGGAVAGYATFGASRGGRPGGGRYQGEIFELYLAPDHQGIGFGEYLFEAARHALDMRQLDGLVVWALIDNQNACDFYWRRGGRPIAECVESFGGTELEKVAFGWH